MKQKMMIGVLTLLMLIPLAMQPVFAGPPPASGTKVVYDSVPSPLAPNYPSQGFECCQVKELGDNIAFDFGGPFGPRQIQLTTVTVIMSDWAKHSVWSSYPAVAWPYPITLNLYYVDHSDPSTPAVGLKFATLTQSFNIPWRPETTPFCAAIPDDAYDVGTGICYHGIAFPITFDFTSLNLALPNEIIYGIAYNTNTMGYSPVGFSGPYDSLNVGLPTTNSPPKVGLDINPDALFRYSSYPTATTIGTQDVGYNSAGPIDVFRQDTGWAPYGLAVQFKTKFTNYNGAVTMPLKYQWFSGTTGPVGNVVLCMRSNPCMPNGNSPPPSNRNLAVTVNLQGVQPSTTYSVGFDIFGACPSTFGGITLGTSPYSFCQTSYPIGIYLMGAATTDTSGKGDFHMNLNSLPTGTYNLIFWIVPCANPWDCGYFPTASTGNWNIGPYATITVV